MRVMVIDGQGGGIGRALLEKLVQLAPEDVELLAIGTNALATANMLKAGRVIGATGENAVIYNAPRADVIAGGAGIIAANSMLGELSPGMANAVAQCDAVKVLIPLNRCNLKVAGISDMPLPRRIDEAAALILSALAEKREA